MLNEKREYERNWDSGLRSPKKNGQTILIPNWPQSDLMIAKGFMDRTLTGLDSMLSQGVRKLGLRKSGAP